MAGMAGGVPSGEGESGGGNALVVLDEVNLIFRRGNHLAPEFVHGIAIDHAGAFHESGGIDEVWGGFWMSVESSALLSPPTSGACVVEVDVGDEDVAD